MTCDSFNAFKKICCLWGRRLYPSERNKTGPKQFRLQRNFVNIVDGDSQQSTCRSSGELVHSLLEITRLRGEEMYNISKIIDL